MKKIKKAKFDENAISGITALIIIIIIGLLLWQFIIPLIDENLQIPSDYLNLRPEKDDIIGNWGVLNIVSNELFNFPMYNNEIYYEPTDVFKAIVYTNAPYSIFSEPYYILFEIYESGQIAYTLKNPIPYTAIYTDEFSFNLNLDLSGSKDYSVECYILDSDSVDMELMPNILFIIPEV